MTQTTTGTNLNCSLTLQEGSTMYLNPAVIQTGYSSTPKAEYSFYKEGNKNLISQTWTLKFQRKLILVIRENN